MSAWPLLIIYVAIFPWNCAHYEPTKEIDNLYGIVRKFTTLQGNALSNFENAKKLVCPLLCASLLASTSLSATPANVTAKQKIVEKQLQILIKDAASPIRNKLNDNSLNGIISGALQQLHIGQQQLIRTCNEFEQRHFIADVSAFLKPCVKKPQRLQYEHDAFVNISAAVKEILKKWVDPVYVEDESNFNLETFYGGIKIYIESTSNATQIASKLETIRKSINDIFNMTAFRLHPTSVYDELKTYFDEQIYSSCDFDYGSDKGNLDIFRQNIAVALLLTGICTTQLHPSDNVARGFAISFGKEIKNYMDTVARQFADRIALYEALDLRAIIAN